MKKFLLSFILLLGAAFALSAQEVCFWTNEYKTLPLRVYIDGQYVGDVTAAYDRTPEYGAEGTLSVVLAPGSHDVAAVNAYGYEYDGWPGTIRPSEDRVNYIKIRKGRFPRYATVDYIVMDPYWYGYGYGPYYHRHHHRHDSPRRSSSSDDDGDLNAEYAVGLAATAVTLFVTGMVGSIINWNYPDSRFPYIAAGLKTEYLPGVNALRNVARVKARIGNYGGMSFIGEAGEALYFGQGWEPTFAAGFGWCYGAFEVDFRYQLPYLSTHQFASLDFSYDWFLTDHFAIDFGLGLGLSGNGDWGGTRWDGVEVPISIGVQYAF